MIYRRKFNRRFTAKNLDRGKFSKFDLARQIEISNRFVKTDVPTFIPKEGAFDLMDLDSLIKTNIFNKGYTAPTEIQAQVIPAVLLNRDVIGIANTGTGKTAAFLIPLITKVVRNRSEKVLIITPTRELAIQINEHFRALSAGTGIYSAVCTGGANMRLQIKFIRQNSNFIIGTPGRLRDLIDQRVLDLSHFKNVVLDETDRMVDIGFLKEIKFFISLLPKERQSLFFSATVSTKVKEILNSFVKNPVTISTKVSETAISIKQEMVRVPFGVNKVEMLHDLLIKKEMRKALVFGKTKWGIEKLTNELIERGFKVGAIHGNKNQGQRNRVLTQFRNDEIKILLATDVASRGLDISDISHVINYDLPNTYDDYVHRIGRTGRIGKKGIAVTLVD
ncbi:hypothetical protein COT49_02915 [candidate division WWE3 bacterium CG08_land_8_20_14_0_20_40_13]|uniref:ATP-dependent helicase n=1 Tax=candidate division WWE3 bacterium CG08_land_8_20_14_0_20_40_13 TaxID=1975084 RepID=A0A2H0XFK1_UNCKA|nr:MAG: hypothetical protein COT49_02915 [candidate division WWE3 bacterium CG08_land_8_20_14_0_20_40_13]